MPGATAASRGQLPLIAGLVGLAALAWLVSAGRMDGMDMGPGTDPGSLGFYVVTWVVMMAAMMFPSIVPTVGVYRLLQLRRRERGGKATSGGTACLVAGYLLTWTAAGLAAFGLLEAGRALAPEALAWERGGRWVAAGVLLAAAAYELTPLKNTCLSRCRGPLGFFLEAWREGRSGAVVMGARHGAWCVGCCWALMAALFALGAMSLTWMALVAALIAVEKLLPWRTAATGAVTAVLIALALLVALAPDDVPALTVPEGGEMRMAPAHR